MKPRPAWAVIGVALVAMLVLVIRTAWMCDDAYITMRTVDNFVNGFGLRWNIDERVQSFTHPAWLLLITPFYAITREAFYTVLTLQISLTLVTLAMLMRSLAQSTAAAVLAAAALASSKAFVEFSTSGLENSLGHFLLLWFLVRWFGCREKTRSTFTLGLLTSALMLCRVDFGILVGPLILAELFPRSASRIKSFIAGLAPLVAWELFSLVYYGSLVPNTALAKLPPGVGLAELGRQGLRYITATWHFDPMTPAILAIGVVTLFLAGSRAGRLAATGIVCHLIYVVMVGGDFMTGRFLTPALFVTVAAAVTTVPLAAKTMPAFASAAVLIIVGALNSSGPFRTGSDFGTGNAVEQLEVHGVTDERRAYYPWLGLLRVISGATSPQQHPAAAYAIGRRAEQRPNDVKLTSVIGLAGYYGGPSIHHIDQNALADPLLARIPPKPGWRIGHFFRDPPTGYFESVQARRNLIEDPRVRALYDDVFLATRAPLFAADRWRAILRLNLQ